MNDTTETIVITPTWESMIPTLVYLIERGGPEGRKSAVEELKRLARFVDQMNASDGKDGDA